MRRAMFFTLLALAALIPAEGLQAQPRRSAWDGVYTEEQAGRGQTQFQQHCARCHGANLAGTFETPPLVGRFIPYWAGTTLDALFDYISTAMPLDHPASLSRGANSDIEAFILKANGFPAGTQELSPDRDRQQTIGFDAAKPQAAAAGRRDTKRRRDRMGVQ